jgi:hypothetical protein
MINSVTNFIVNIISNIEFWKLFISFSSPFLIAILAFVVFKRQKEYETIQKRYLNEGFDQLISETEFALSSFRNNWATSLILIKQIKELPHHSINDNLLNEFIGLKNNILPTIAIHRVNILLSSSELWKMHQNLFSFIITTFNFFSGDITTTVKIFKEDPSKFNVTNEDIFKEFFNKLLEFDKESRKFDKYMGLLKIMAKEFEDKVHSKKDLNNFKNREIVTEFNKLLESKENT